MSRSKFWFAIAGLALANFSCGDECRSTLDCEDGAFCYNGTCKKPAGAERTCGSDLDCNPGSGPGGPYVCLVGVCTPRDPVSRPDSGVNLPDTGSPDGGTPADGGPKDSGADAGNPPADAGNPPADAGNPPADAGNPPADAGNPPADAGNPPADAGNPPADAGNPPADAGNPPADGGTPPADGGTSPDAGGGADAGPTTLDHVVFVTSGQLPGAFQGRANARTFCNQAGASVAGRTDWEPLISDDTTDLISFLALRGPVRNVAGTLVANDLADLLNGPSGPVLTESGGAGSGLAWTGTLPTGLRSSNHCAGWKQTGALGQVGQVTSTLATWIALDALPCSQSARLYCISMGP